MLTIATSQTVPVSGYYADGHGHLLLLKAGDRAPICVFSGAAIIRWRLVRPSPITPSR